MTQVNTSFPDSTYSSSNKPSVATLKADIQAVETAVNEIDTNAIRKDATVAMTADWSMGSNKITNLKAPTSATDAASIGVCWPVGSVYTNKTVATNPAILFGIGTWVAIEGEVVVGYKSGDASFGTPGGAVGAKTVAHTHTGPSHTHTGPSHQHWFEVTSGANNNQETVSSGTGSGVADGIHAHNVQGATQFEGTGATGAEGTGATSSTSPSVIQPSRICYVWKRTA